MTDDELRRLSFMESRIPQLNALEVFVPTGSEADAAVNEVRSRSGFSRWFPVEGGHKVQILYEGGDYDRNRFALIEGGWDHEHCRRCQLNIEPMTLCWVTDGGPFVLLCVGCHAAVFEFGAAIRKRRRNSTALAIAFATLLIIEEALNQLNTFAVRRLAAKRHRQRGTKHRHGIARRAYGHLG